MQVSFSSEQERKAAIDAVYAKAVRAGVWLRPDQRPGSFFRSLLAQPWHDPYRVEACRILEAAFEVIQAEALALLRADSSADSLFESYNSAALAAGDWCDVGLFFNAKCVHV